VGSKIVVDVGIDAVIEGRLERWDRLVVEIFGWHLMSDVRIRL